MGAMLATGLWATIAIVGGTVYPGDGPALDKATVVIDGDRIVAVGQGIDVPAGATFIDAGGKIVTPGLIDAATGLGLAEISAVEDSSDADAGGPPIRAAQRAVDSFNPHSAVIPVQRAHGITTVISAHKGGLISGQAGAFDLWPEAPIEKIADSPVAMMASYGGRGDGARGRTLTELREVLDAARQYARDPKAFERNQFRPTQASRLDLQALIPVIRGKLPLAVSVQRQADIATLVRFAEVEKLRIILLGAAESWRMADALAAAQIPVVLDPVTNLPFSLDAVHVRDDTGAVLARAGVRIALTTFSTHNVRKLRQWAGNAVRAGLPYDEAMRAVTASPAVIYGLDDRGRLAAGQLANVVIWSGDPFELSSRAERVFVRGHDADLRHRQTALFDCYRKLPPCGMGPAARVERR